nr:uncharacterized protein LOC111986559 [Quercus suber]
MNVIIWNCREALKPTFQGHVRELIRIHNSAILVLMETKFGGERAREITDRLPFDGVIHTDIIGWLISAIYASPRSAERHILWNNLNKVVELHDMPWVIAGDFNEILTAEDKFGGKAVGVSSSLLFKECLDNCNMIDIGFAGRWFTWTNKREVHALIQERLDRFFVNPSWCLLYPDARVMHLTRCHSDHCPVKLEMLPKNATEWNRNHFGNIFVKKKNIMARLNGIQQAVASKPSNFLLNVEKELVKECDTILSQEEELWALKSRVN